MALQGFGLVESRCVRWLRILRRWEGRVVSVQVTSENQTFLGDMDYLYMCFRVGMHIAISLA